MERCVVDQKILTKDLRMYARNVLYGLDEILAAELIQYDWNEHQDDRTKMGSLAIKGSQHKILSKLLLSLVFESFGGTYGVDQNGLIATAWNGIKQLNEKQEVFAADIGGQVS